MQNTNQTHITAGAILIGFIFIAAAIFFKPVPTTAVVPNDTLSEDARVAKGIDPKRSADVQRNIYGNPEAETTIVEFSDFECPFCSRVHPTIKRLVDESKGSVNWEYRHLPLPNHANAKPGAIAAECVADLAGNDAFWSFSDAVFANQRTLSDAFFRETAVGAGVDAGAYDSCIASTEVATRVEKDAGVAATLGGNGTPYSVISYADGSTRPVNGALPYEHWVPLLQTN